MEPPDKSIPAAILTAAYLDNASAKIDEYMKVYGDFLNRLELLDRETSRQSAQHERQQFNRNYQYKKSTD